MSIAWGLKWPSGKAKRVTAVQDSALCGDSKLCERPPRPKRREKMNGKKERDNCMQKMILFPWIPTMCLWESFVWIDFSLECIPCLKHLSYAQLKACRLPFFHASDPRATIQCGLFLLHLRGQEWLFEYLSILYSKG